MAQYHLTVKIISRAAGKSVVAAAAYRACIQLQDNSIGKSFDYSNKKDNVHSEILAPDNAPSWVTDREVLWNEVENIEKRKDAQLAREVEVSLPIEFSMEQNVNLIREYVNDNFVAKGMIADINIHNKDGNPHAHILLTLRDITPEGFGQKNRSWNNKTLINEWRENWANVQNQHLSKAGFDIVVDHRSYVDRGIDLEPQIHKGPMKHMGLDFDNELDLMIDTERVQTEVDNEYIEDTSNEREVQLTPGSDIKPKIRKRPKKHVNYNSTRDLDRMVEYERISSGNGKRIIADPTIAINHLANHNAVFSEYDILKCANLYSHGLNQFNKVRDSIIENSELIYLGTDHNNVKRYTSRDMMLAEEAMYKKVNALHNKYTHTVKEKYQEQAASQRTMTDEQLRVFYEVINGPDISCIEGVAGSGKSYVLGAINDAYEAQGYHVIGATISGIAAEGLHQSSGIQSKTITRLLWDISHNRLKLSNKSVLVIDEAGMIGTKQMQNLVGLANYFGAKIIPVGDREQTQAMAAGGSLRGIVDQVNTSRMQNVIRQKNEWQKQATINLSSNLRDNVLTGIDLYNDNGKIHYQTSLAEAKLNLVSDWSASIESNKNDSHLILAFKNDDVKELNLMAREKMKELGYLGKQSHMFKIQERSSKKGLFDKQEKENSKKGFFNKLFNTEQAENKDFDFDSKQDVIELSINDRIMFTKNDGHGIKNGTIGTIQSIHKNSITVQIDSGELVVFNINDYNHIKYGYAATINKTQGVTVDRTYSFITTQCDKHLSYVALTRHREDAQLYAGINSVYPENGCFESKSQFNEILSQTRYKNLVSDYAYLRNIEPPESRIVDLNDIVLKDDLNEQDMNVIFKYLTRHHSVFLDSDIHKFAKGYARIPDLKEAILKSSELVKVGYNDKNMPLYSSLDVLNKEMNMFRHADELHSKKTFKINDSIIENINNGLKLYGDQLEALIHITNGTNISNIVGYAGTGKSYLLGAVKQAYETQGYDVQGCALSGIASENLQTDTGIKSTTIYKFLRDVSQGKIILTDRSIVVLDEAGLVGTHQMEEILKLIAAYDSKIILAGDYQQLQSIAYGGPFKGLVDKYGHATLNTVIRQEVDWQKKATIELSGSESDVKIALERYLFNRHIHFSSHHNTALEHVSKGWMQGVEAEPSKIHHMFAFRRKDVDELNERARKFLLDRGLIDRDSFSYVTKTNDTKENLIHLDDELILSQKSSTKDFSRGDRLMFLRNDMTMNVKNGSLSTIIDLNENFITVVLDNSGETVRFSPKLYDEFTHGYASTIHKTQGVTVDKSYVLATKHFDKHLSYVALSRHKENVAMYGCLGKTGFENKDDFFEKMSRDNLKDLALDYAQNIKTGPVKIVEENVSEVFEQVRPVVESLKPMEDTKLTAQELIWEAKEMHAHIQQDGKGGFMSAMKEIQNGMSIGARKDELERFKTEINLSEYAAHKGYAYDKKESYSNIITMRTESDKINISRGQDGHWVYKSWTSGKGGSIIDFIQNNELKSIGEVRKELRPWIGEQSIKPIVPESHYQRSVQPVKKDRESVLAEMNQAVESNDHQYLKSRGIDRIDSRFQGKVFIDSYKNAVFPHIDREGVCCLEKRNYEFKGMSKGGDKGLWVSHTYKHDNRLVITEAPIDALSYHEINRDENTRYISFGGRMNEKQQELLKAAINKMPDNSVIILATDHGKDGEMFAKDIAAMSENKAHRIVRDAPEIGKDWNEQLKHLKGISQEAKKEKDNGYGLSI